MRSANKFKYSLYFVHKFIKIFPFNLIPHNFLVLEIRTGLYIVQMLHTNMSTFLLKSAGIKKKQLQLRKFNAKI